MTPPANDFPCNRFVELVTEYLEGALPASDVARLEPHLEICRGCRSVLAQFRMILRISGRLREADVDALDPAEREPLMAAFREWAVRRT